MSDGRETAGHKAFAERLRTRLGRDLDPRVTLRDQAEEGKDSVQERMERRREAVEPSVTRYEVLGEMGRGGMGAIMKAWDIDLRRTLAMKVMFEMKGADGEEPRPEVRDRALARFIEEAQITGQLDHPGIVPVHELGLDSNGKIFFTMRLVRGRELSRVLDLLHSDEGGWSLPRALRALLKVCEAMDFAHSKGVLHRDLKPANIMVGDYGEVYVMDWGLARVLGREDTTTFRTKRRDPGPTSTIRTDRDDARVSSMPSAHATMDGDILGTPAYMSPEQARGELDRLDSRSDVFSIGAILYHMLSGRMPYLDDKDENDVYRVLLRAQKGAPMPLTMCAPEAPAEVVAICEKAMAFEPADRYSGVREMAEDLHSFLDGRVVRAYETGAVAELKKWVKRNRATALASAAAIVLALGSLVSISVLQSRSNERLEAKNVELVAARDLAQEKEGVARRERDASDRVIEFLTELFESPDPARTRGEKITVKEVLDRGAASVTAGLEDDPLLEARLRQTMGRVYHSLGLYREADPLLARALHLRGTELGVEHPETLRTAADLAMLERSRGRFDDAERLYERVLEGQTRNLEGGDTSRLETLGELALVHFHQGRFDDAQRLYEEALQGMRHAVGDGHPDTLRAMGNMALLHRDLGQYEDATKLMEEALEGYRSLFGEDHPDTLSALHELSTTLYLTGQLDEAGELLEQALEGRTRVLGELHPDTLLSLNDLGNLLWDQGLAEEAEEVYEQALAGSRQGLGPDHPRTLTILNNLGRLRLLQRRMPEAEAAFVEVVERAPFVWDEDHPKALGAINNLAFVYLETGRLANAEPLFAEALAGLRDLLGDAHENTLITLQNLVEVRVGLGRHAETEALARELVERTPAAAAERAERERLLDSILAKIESGE